MRGKPLRVGENLNKSAVEKDTGQRMEEKDGGMSRADGSLLGARRRRIWHASPTITNKSRGDYCWTANNNEAHTSCPWLLFLTPLCSRLRTLGSPGSQWELGGNFQPIKSGGRRKRMSDRVVASSLTGSGPNNLTHGYSKNSRERSEGADSGRSRTEWTGLNTAQLR
jgi:hypothetical protein